MSDQGMQASKVQIFALKNFNSGNNYENKSNEKNARYFVPFVIINVNYVFLK